MGHLLVLGAKSDIGRFLAKKYASVGFDICLADKETEPLEATAQYINEEFGVDTHTLKFDVTEFYNHRNFYNTISPVPTGVVCVVDYQGDGERAQKDFLEAKRIMDINYTGLVAMFNIIANEFEERGSGFITVIGLDEDENPHYIYKSAKDAFASYINGLKIRLGKSGINVISAIQGQTAGDTEKFANKIFTAQQKGKDTVSSKGNGGLATLVKGLKWK